MDDDGYMTHELLVPEMGNFYFSLRKLSVGVLVVCATLLGLSVALNEVNQATSQHHGTYVFK